MSTVKHSPPVTSRPVSNLSPGHFGSDPVLNRSPNIKEGMETQNITKRQKRTFDSYSETSPSAMAEVRSMFSELKLQQEHKFDYLTGTINTVIEQNEEIKHSVEFMSQQYDEMLTKMNHLETQNAEYKKQIKSLESKLELMEKNSRLSAIEIRNIQKTKQENKQTLCGIIKGIGSLVSPQNCIQESEIRDIFRTKSDAIVVDFTTITRKETLLHKIKEHNKSRREQKDTQLNTQQLNLEGPSRTIYVSEYLTHKAKRLHYLAREYVKNKQLFTAWTSYGKVYVKKKEGLPAQRIDEEKDLHMIAS